MSLSTVTKTGPVTTLLSEMDFPVLSKLRDCSKTQRAVRNANVVLFYLTKGSELFMLFTMWSRVKLVWKGKIVCAQ